MNQAQAYSEELLKLALSDQAKKRLKWMGALGAGMVGGLALSKLLGKAPGGAARGSAIKADKVNIYSYANDLPVSPSKVKTAMTSEEAFQDELSKLGVSLEWIGKRMSSTAREGAAPLKTRLFEMLGGKAQSREELRSLVKERLRRIGHRVSGPAPVGEIDQKLFGRLRKDPVAHEEYQGHMGKLVGLLEGKKASAMTTEEAFNDELSKLAISPGKAVNAIFHRVYGKTQIVPTINRMAKGYVETAERMGSPVTREGAKSWIKEVQKTKSL